MNTGADTLALTLTLATTLPLTALLTGLFGSLHCLGMCGGISGSIALATPLRKDLPTASGRTFPVAVTAAGMAASMVAAVPNRAAWVRLGPNVLAFNLGRISSYTLAGALAGGIGGIAMQPWFFTGVSGIRGALYLFANLMIVLTGLYIMGISRWLAPLERAGSRLWRHIAPYGRQFMTMETPSQAARFGIIWGWIPCGMVYAMLLAAISAGGAREGAITMFAFGVGTLPSMLLAGVAAGSLRHAMRHPRIRMAAGLAVIAMGLFGVARAGMLEQLQTFGAFCVATN